MMVADHLVAAMSLLGDLKIETNDFNGARTTILHAYSVLNMHVSHVSPAIAHRLYSHMAGVSRSTVDINHWVSNAHLLGKEGNSPLNLVMLSLFYCSPCLLRDPRNRPIPNILQIPISQIHLKQKDVMLYQKMLSEIEETENVLYQSDPYSRGGAVHPEDHMGDASDGNLSMDQLLCFRVILTGCRALVLAQCGYQDESLSSAEKCLAFGHQIQNRVMFWPIPVAISYALMVFKSFSQMSSFHTGITMLESFAGHFGIVPPILSLLTSKVGGPFENPNSSPSDVDLGTPLEVSFSKNNPLTFPSLSSSSSSSLPSSSPFLFSHSSHYLHNHVSSRLTGKSSSSSSSHPMSMDKLAPLVFDKINDNTPSLPPSFTYDNDDILSRTSSTSSMSSSTSSISSSSSCGSSTPSLKLDSKILNFNKSVLPSFFRDTELSSTSAPLFSKPQLFENNSQPIDTMIEQLNFNERHSSSSPSLGRVGKFTSPSSTSSVSSFESLPSLDVKSEFGSDKELPKTPSAWGQRIF
eukprot:TRINITY_DN760_c0_g1_i2.p1 TRINITY_DN760_c0_g1~~TRINITY_DN760_c0_g1_i2.p1  ORF type:complete len:522 (+),score=117.59 TRINITY_DN760_c0_g1_i2:1069-2634(+)